MLKHIILIAALLLPLPALAASQQEDLDKIAILTADRDAYIKTVDQFRVQLLADERQIAQLQAQIQDLQKKAAPAAASAAPPAAAPKGAAPAAAAAVPAKPAPPMGPSKQKPPPKSAP